MRDIGHGHLRGGLERAGRPSVKGQHAICKPRERAMMTPEQKVAEQLRRMVSDPRIATAAGLQSTLRLLAKWRSKMIDRTVVVQHGTEIMAGPFKGMHFVDSSVEANISPKLLGSYEAELHSVVEEIIASGFERIIDVGCADGYYAVGFALRMPRTKIYAFDVDARAQRQCQGLAERNGVAKQIRIG